MYRDTRRDRVVDSAEGSPASEAWLFAQAILGKPIFNPASGARSARAGREQLELLAAISDRHRDRLCRVQSDELAAAREREQLEWLAQISEEHERKLRTLLRNEAKAREAQQHHERLIESSEVQEAQWDPSKHPRLGGSPNAGWFATTGGSGSTSAAPRVPSTFAGSSPRNGQRAELTVTPRMIRSTGWLGKIHEKLRLAGDVASAFVAGLGTGAKAVVNGLATAARSVGTLGLNTDQLDLIGVTKEDRARGYDTAVTISTGSGQVLIAVGTGGMASALAKGGTITRAASGALVAFDSAGNAVGVVQGVYDASQNGVTLANGTQVAASALGITANIRAAKGRIKPRAPAPTPPAPGQATPSPTRAKAPARDFQIGKHGDMPSPRPGQHSHHGVMSAWMEKNFPGYDAKKAPAILMPDRNHRATYRTFNKWKADIAKKMGGTFDWKKVGETDMRALCEDMFDAADVPSSVREEYWAQFEQMKAALRRLPPQALEARLWGEQVMNEEADVFNAEEMQQQYGNFYKSSPMARLDRSNVPEQFWPLIPYAEFWGMADDWTREDLVKSSPRDVRENLKRVVAAFDNALDEWLAGPEADAPEPSDEYVAFSAMRMAAYYV